MKLEYIPVPVWSPPGAGPWTIRETWPDGRQATYQDYKSLIWDDRTDAQQWADWANRQLTTITHGVVYDVVPATR